MPKGEPGEPSGHKLYIIIFGVLGSGFRSRSSSSSSGNNSLTKVLLRISGRPTDGCTCQGKTFLLWGNFCGFTFVQREKLSFHTLLHPHMEVFGTAHKARVVTLRLRTQRC